MSSLGFLLHLSLVHFCHAQVAVLKNAIPIFTKNYSQMFKDIKTFHIRMKFIW